MSVSHHHWVASVEEWLALGSTPGQAEALSRDNGLIEHGALAELYLLFYQVFSFVYYLKWLHTCDSPTAGLIKHVFNQRGIATSSDVITHISLFLNISAASFWWLQQQMLLFKAPAQWSIPAQVIPQSWRAADSAPLSARQIEPRHCFNVVLDCKNTACSPPLQANVSAQIKCLSNRNVR